MHYLTDLICLLYRPTAFSVFVLLGKPSPPQSWQQGCAPLARHAKVEDAVGADEPHSMELQCYQQANGIHSLMMLPHPLASTTLVLARYRTDTEPQVLLPSAHQRSTGWWLHLCDFLSSEMGQEQRIPQQSEPRTPLRCVQRWPPLLLRPAEGHTQQACSLALQCWWNNWKRNQLGISFEPQPCYNMAFISFLTMTKHASFQNPHHKRHERTRKRIMRKWWPDLIWLTQHPSKSFDSDPALEPEIAGHSASCRTRQGYPWTWRYVNPLHGQIWTRKLLLDKK